MLIYNTYTRWTLVHHVLIYSIFAIDINCSKWESQRMDYLMFTIPHFTLTSKSALFIRFSEKSIKIQLKDYDDPKAIITPPTHPLGCQMYFWISTINPHFHVKLKGLFKLLLFFILNLLTYSLISSINFKNNKQHLSSHYTLPIMAPISFMRNQNVVSIPQQFCIHFKRLVPINSILSTAFSTFAKQGNF